MLFCNFCPGSPKVATVACENCSYYYCSACLKKFHPKAGPLKTHNIVKGKNKAHNYSNEMITAAKYKSIYIHKYSYI